MATTGALLIHLALLMTVSLAWIPSALAVTTRINPGGGPEEPANHHSWLIGHGPQGAFVAVPRNAPDPAFDIRDDDFASKIFQGTNIGQTPHSAMLFTMGQCNSSGFLDDLAAGVGAASIGFTAAARWDQCSFSTAAGNTFLQPWGNAVDAPHPANDEFLAAYNFAVANDPNSGATFPQYYAVDSDAKTLNLGGGNNNFAILFVGDTYGRPDFFLDIDQIHRILTTQYGFDEAHIFALYGDGLRRDAGNAGSPALPVYIDGPGTRAQLEGAIAAVDGAWVPNDGFFFWSSNHGLETVPAPAALVLVLLGVFTILARRLTSGPR